MVNVLPEAFPRLFPMDMEGGGGGVPELKKKISSGKYVLYGVLIYSNTDNNFITFLNEAHDSLAEMSGTSCFLWWFEHFEKDCVLLWKPKEAPRSLRIKVSRNESLKLAKAQKIPMAKTPCILICRNLDETNTVVYSFDNSWTYEQFGEHFKAIFDIIENIIDNIREDSNYDAYGDLEKQLTALKIKKWVKRTVSNQSIGNMLKAIATGSKFA